MKKYARRNLMFDRMHKGVVISCMALTLYGTYLLGARLHNYYTNLRPQIKLKQAEEKEKLLQEGKDYLHDSVPELKA